LTPICTKSFVGWSLAPDPYGEHSHIAIAPFRGLLLKEREGRATVEGEKRRGIHTLQ